MLFVVILAEFLGYPVDTKIFDTAKRKRELIQKIVHSNYLIIKSWVDYGQIFLYD